MEFNNTITTPFDKFRANKKNGLVAIAIGLLAVATLFFGVQYFVAAEENKKLQEQLKSDTQKEQAVAFLDLFVQKVLKTDKEVAFEDRLKLENAIRDINDPELLAKWEKFTGGTTEAQIQQGVKDLLEALVAKISQ